VPCHSYRCVDCGATVDETNRVEVYRINPLAGDFSRIAVRCYACTDSYVKRATYGEVDTCCMEMACELLSPLYTVPMDTCWVQGDYLAFFVLVWRRRAEVGDEALTLSEVPSDVR
jgi:hypothetical protein